MLPTNHFTTIEKLIDISTAMEILLCDSIEFKVKCLGLLGFLIDKHKVPKPVAHKKYKVNLGMYLLVETPKI